MKTQNKKILALINIEEPFKAVVQSTVNLANSIDAEINFFHVEKKFDPTRTENQLAVLKDDVDRDLSIEKLKNVVSQMKEDTGVAMDCTIERGSIKKHIANMIASYQPDIIVLGKRSPKVYRVIGKQIKEFILKKFEGPVFLAHPSKVLQLEEHLSMGMLNYEYAQNDTITNVLLQRSKKPLKLFTFDGNAEKKPLKLEATINYSFENNENALYSLTNYVQKNNVNLLCLDRTKKQKNTSLKKLLKSLDTPMLMVGTSNTKNLINI